MTNASDVVGILPSDLIATASIIAGFGITVIMFRVQREVTVQDEKRTPVKSRLAWADYLIILSISLALLLVVVPLIWFAVPSAKLRAVAAAACVAAVVLQLGYIPSILAHYGISLGKQTATEERSAGQPVETWIAPLSGLVAAVLFVIVLCHNLRPE